MPLVNAKCTNCGANLNVDSSKDAAICEFCGSAFIVEKAVNNYNVVNNNHINANTVNIYGSTNNDFQIRAGKLEKYIGEGSEVVIPNSVSIIGHHAFDGCRGISVIVIPNTVRVIEACAFRHCEGLTSIEIPASVVEIQNNAFNYCTNLSRIVIPGSVKEIGIFNEAFSCCSRLNDIVFLDGVKKIDTTAFSCCFNIRRMVIPDSVVEFNNLYKDENRTLARIYGVNEVCASESCKRRLGNELDSLTWETPLYRGKRVSTNANYEPPRLNNHSHIGYKEKGCYIATCVYGSYDCPQVWTLRRFRDNSLATTWYGRIFIRIYYAVSPKLVKLFGYTVWFKKLWLRKLDSIVARLQKQGVESTPYQDESW